MTVLFVLKVLFIVYVTVMMGARQLYSAATWIEASRYDEPKTESKGAIYTWAWFMIVVPFTVPAWFWLFGTGIGIRVAAAVHVALLCAVPFGIASNDKRRSWILKMGEPDKG